MAADTEPTVKKLKMESKSVIMINNYMDNIRDMKGNLQPVLSDDFYKPIPLIKVYVGHVKNPKELSRIIMILNEKIPLKELQHLKRVRKREVLLCPTHYLNGMSSIQEYLECHVQELKDVFEYFKDIDVPLIPPKIKAQYNNQQWSLNFHPNKYYEKLLSNNFFSRDELKIHINCMQIAFETAKWYLQGACDVTEFDPLSNINATVIYEPYNNSVVAAAVCNRSHPVQHSTMVAIDNVAKTQNGGTWNVPPNQLERTLSGIDSDLLKHLRMKFTKMKYGARPYKSKRDLTESGSSEFGSISSDGPYLCTGYYIYVLREPCIMCSMALVHARAKRIFFCFDNLGFGAVKSKTKLQCIPSLNHHFEVFTGFL